MMPNLPPSGDVKPPYPKRAYSPQTTVYINQVRLTALQWTVNVGMNGSIGTANITTTRDKLLKSGIDLDKIADSAKATEIIITAQGYNDSELIVFGGIYDHDEEVWNSGQIEIIARDWAEILINTREVLTDINYQNQTASDIAKSIGSKFGFTLDVTEVPDPSVKAGQLMEKDTTFTAGVNEYWRILQFLAKSVGYDCYITPGQVLYFGPPLDTAKLPRQLTWKPDPTNETAQQIFAMTTRRSPRRNGNFRVQVFSYHIRTATPVAAEAFVIVTPLTIPKVNDPTVIATPVNEKQYGPGTYIGPAGAVFGKDLSTLPNIDKISKAAPIYSFRVNGLSEGQAKQLAVAYAKEIGRRAKFADITIDGDPTLNPQRRVILKEGIKGVLGSWVNTEMEIVSISHIFANTGDGFVTKIECLVTPPGVIDDAAQGLNQIPGGGLTIPSGGSGGFGPGIGSSPIEPVQDTPSGGNDGGFVGGGGATDGGSGGGGSVG